MTIAPMVAPPVTPATTSTTPGVATPGAAAGDLGFGALVAALVAESAPCDTPEAPDPAVARQDTAESAPCDTEAAPDAAVGEDETAESAPCDTAAPVLLELLAGRIPHATPVPVVAALPPPVEASAAVPLSHGAYSSESPELPVAEAATTTSLTTDRSAPDAAVRRADGTATDAPAAAGQASTSPALPAPQASTPPTGPPDPGAAAMAGVVGSTPAASVERPAAPAVTAAVTRQVFPEVTRLASSGNGTHRVTLRLDPGSLGEVRVTLTVSAGQVRVSLAAGQEARDALLYSSPELRRLLERGGADATVSIRDLGATPGALLDRSTSRDDTAAAYARAAGEQVPSGSDRPGAGDTGPQRGPGHDQHARTRGDITARDGSPDPTTPSRPVELRTSRGPSGLDVSI